MHQALRLSHTNPSQSRIKCVAFCGGRGFASIADSLIRYPHMELTTVVNCYDDGLSTGMLRKLIPGLLGPSDVRKNASNQILGDIRSPLFHLKRLLEYRLPCPSTNPEMIKILKSLESWNPEFCAEIFKSITLHQYEKIQLAVKKFLQITSSKLLQEPMEYPLADCSFGNIIFSGMFLLNNCNYNSTVSDFVELCGSQGFVKNITDGQNFFLVTLLNNGEILWCEGDMVVTNQKASVLDIYLLSNLPTDHEKKELQLRSLEEKKSYLAQLHQTPKPNIEVIEKIKDADLIIYAPGTYYSSLFPSYLTSDVAKTIATNNKAQKIFISNLLRDCYFGHVMKIFSIRFLVKVA